MNKAYTAFNRLMTIEKTALSGKVKHEFYQDVAVSLL